MKLKRSLFPLRRIIRLTMKSMVKYGKDETGVSVMLNSVMDEYTKEKQRSLSLDGKASFFMTTIIAMFTFLLPQLPFKQIIDNITTDNFVFYGCLFSILVGMIFLIFSFFKMFTSYQLVSYKGLNIDGFENKKNMDCFKCEAQEGLCRNYAEILKENADRNDIKAQNIRTGIKFVFLGFIFLLLGTILLLLTIEIYFQS